MKKILPAMLLTVLLMIFAAVPMNVNAAVYQQGVVYVIYDETGEKAPKDMTDANTNGVPDFVEDLATQLNATRELFHEVFNFPDPLKSERFKNVTSIEIDIEAKTETNKANGNAYSGVRKKSRHNPNERAIHIRVANTVDPHRHVTTTHEYFHLIQYGATHFRNKWFLEGMARWSQDALSKINYPPAQDIPRMLKDNGDKERLFQRSYKAAELFWYPLAMDMHDKAKIPSRLMKKYKYVNGSPVFHDDIFYGPNVMLKVLRAMKAKENDAAISEGFANVGEWHRKGQRDERNSEFIMDCVREVYRSKNS